MTDRITNYRDHPADLADQGDPGVQHPLDAMAAATAIVGEIASFIDPDAPVDADDCALYRNRLRLAYRTLTAAHRELMPHRASIAALLDHGDPVERLTKALDTRMARMTAYLAQPLDPTREAEVRAKLAEAQALRHWLAKARF